MTDSIETERLVLRPVVVDDADGPYLAWLNDPEVNQYLESRFTTHNLQGLREYIEAQARNPLVHFFAITTRVDGRHVGNIKLGPIEPTHQRGDIGILLGERSSWGCGLASEAIEAVCSWAFDSLGLHKITAGAYEQNVGSVRAFIRAGFTVEAVRPEHYLSDRDWIAAVLLARFKPHTRVDNRHL